MAGTLAFGLILRKSGLCWSPRRVSTGIGSYGRPVSSSIRATFVGFGAPEQENLMILFSLTFGIRARHGRLIVWSGDMSDPVRGHDRHIWCWSSRMTALDFRPAWEVRRPSDWRRGQNVAGIDVPQLAQEQFSEPRQRG